MLKRLIADYQPENMAVVFDAKGKTFRDEIYKEYKATRQEMPGELVVQIEPIHRIITAMGIPLIMVEGVEADDVIGTLAAQAAQAGVPTLISTGDKDLAQLVNDHITLINTMTNTTLDPKGVQEKFGVPPERIIDYLTLVGDTSDNIPGVPQVGPKTAAKWLQIYGSLANIVANAEKISGKVGDNLRQSLSQLPLTQSLVTIKMDVDLPLSFADLKIKPADKSVLIDCYKEMEFKNWLSELLEERKENNTDKYKNYRIITDENAFNDLLKQIDQAHEIAFDTETTSLDYMNAQLVGLSIAFAPGTAFYVPFGHDYPGAPRQLTKNRYWGS